MFPTVQRLADPYWRKETAQLGIDVDESAAVTGNMVSVDFRARTKPFSALTREGQERRVGTALVTAPLSNYVSVASGHVLAAVAGTTAAWLPYEIALSRNVALIDYPSDIILPSHSFQHDVFHGNLDRVYTLVGDNTVPTLFGGPYVQSGWTNCFSQEAPTQGTIFCFTYSIPLSRQVAESHNVESLIDAIGALPNIGQIVSERLRALALLRQEEADASGMSVDSLLGLYLALSGVSDLALPSITLTGDGNLYATWRIDRERVFSAHFLGKDEARYVLIRPDPRDSSRTLRSTGSVPADSVFKLPETSAARWAFT